MSDLHEIANHIRSVNLTRQMTNAMFLLSSARVKKVASHIEYNQNYYHRVRKAMKDILIHTQGEGIEGNYLNASSKRSKPLYIVISSDKGMCGSYNVSLLNLVCEDMQQHNEYTLSTAGFIATSFFMKKGMLPDITWLGMVQDPKLSFARSICDDILKGYDAGEVDEIILCYTHFINVAKQYPVIKRILPLNVDDFSDEEASQDENGPMIYEPSPSDIFQYIVPQYLTGIIHQALCMSYASENAARMNAMQNSTNNADEMLEKLRTEYNRKRQFGITQDIIEIAASSHHQKGGMRNGAE